MARVTVEDCVKKIPNRFDLVIAAAQRSREISNGIAIEVDRDNDKNPVVSLREIASEAVDAESLQERFIRSMQKNLNKEDNNIEEEASLEEEFAAYLNESKAETKTNDEFILNNARQDEGSFDLTTSVWSYGFWFKSNTNVGAGNVPNFGTRFKLIKFKKTFILATYKAGAEYIPALKFPIK